MLAVDADSVTFEGATVSAIVNRNLAAGPDDGEIEVSLLGMSSIEVKRSAVSSEPKVGQVFVESDRLHRIERVEPRDITWFCVCQQSPA